RETPQVLEHDRVVVEGVRRAEETAAVREPAFGHGLDHDVDIAAVVEVAVTDDDRVKLRQVDLALGVLHDGAGPWVEGDASLLVLQVEAARSDELFGDHEPSPRRPHERELHLESLYPPRFAGRWRPD